jgi:hypothetical protein
LAQVPSYAATPRGAAAQVSAANVNRDGTGTLVIVLQGAASGTRIDGFRIKATGATTAGMIRFFLTDGATTRLIEEVSVAAITPSGSIQTFGAYLVLPKPLVLPNASWAVKAATHNAEAFNIFPLMAGDF